MHATLSRSGANGPGVRFVVWSQGCSLGCAGCFNPETHPVALAAPGAPGGGVHRVSDLVDRAAAADGVEGVTLTGGEPLEQPLAVEEFCRELRIRRPDLGIVVLTGFTRAEVEREPRRAAAVAFADLVVAGRYNVTLHLGSGLRGSSNKEYWALTGRYTAADLAGVPESEFVIAADGSMTLTGMRVWQAPPAEDTPERAWRGSAP